MALRAAAVVAKTLLTEESETVLSTAVRMIRTTAVEEGGFAMQSSETVGMVSRSVIEGGVADVSHAGGEGLTEASKISEITPKAPKEFEVNTPREVPGTKGPPEIQPGHYQGEKKELGFATPNEVNFPDPKTVPEVKPGEAVEIKHIEREAELDKKEQDILENITKNVPADPSNINPVIEQARRQEAPEMGEVRTTVEVDRDRGQQESTDDGQRQLDVDSASTGPEVGRNPLQEQI